MYISVIRQLVSTILIARQPYALTATGVRQPADLAVVGNDPQVRGHCRHREKEVGVVANPR